MLIETTCLVCQYRNLKEMRLAVSLKHGWAKFQGLAGGARGCAALRLHSQAQLLHHSKHSIAHKESKIKEREICAVFFLLGGLVAKIMDQLVRIM